MISQKTCAKVQKIFDIRKFPDEIGHYLPILPFAFTYFVCCTLFVASGFNQEYIPLDFLDSELIIPLDFFKIMLFIRLYFCKTLRNSFIFCTFAPDFIT